MEEFLFGDVYLVTGYLFNYEYLCVCRLALSLTWCGH